jgi:hypothetical protein
MATEGGSDRRGAWGWADLPTVAEEERLGIREVAEVVKETNWFVDR